MCEAERPHATYDNPHGLGTRLSFPLRLGTSARRCSRLSTYTDLFLTAAARVTLQVGKSRLKEVTWLAQGRGAGERKSQDVLWGASGMRCESALSSGVVGGSGSRLWVPAWGVLRGWQQASRGCEVSLDGLHVLPLRPFPSTFTLLLPQPASGSAPAS